MVVFLLEIKANLENVAKISLPDGHEYCIDIQNSAGEDTRQGVRVSSARDQDLPGSRGTAHFMLKWVKDAKHAAHLTVTPVKNVTRAYTEKDSGSFVPIIAFDCRGLDPIGWHPEDGFLVESPSGQRWQDVDLSEDWAEYDEKLGDSVSIMELEHRFIPHR